MRNGRRRLAIVTTHPIQYYAPWFRWISQHCEIDLKVFYLWDPRTTTQHDTGFQREVAWDLPLLKGYESEFVPNTSSQPGTEMFLGIRNEKLESRIRAFQPNAALLIGYRYPSLLQLIFSVRRSYPLIFRGDSHRLAARKAEKLKTETLKSEIRKWGIRQIYKRFEAFLYVGQANRDYFRQHGVPEDELFFAPHAIDNDRFSGNIEKTIDAARRWRAELGISDESLLVLFAGKFEEKKKPLDLLRAFERLENKGAALLFVGSGELETELRGQASQNRRVFFAPFQNQSQMPRTYAACDLFVLPSYGPQESWGLAVNEAMCLSKPIVISSHVGCGPDLVRSNENGLIFEAGNVEALTAALHEALSDRGRLKQWGARSFEIVQRYDYAHATEGLMNALNYVLSR